jgi:hypothetical protein
MKKALFALAALLAPAACERASELGPCSLPYFPPSISVTVQDSVTGANVAPGASVVARSGGYVDSVMVQPGAIGTSMGEGRIGIFAVTVRQSGYLTWTTTGVKVEGAECGARTVDLTARLQPAP